MIADLTPEELTAKYEPHVKKTFAADRQFVKVKFTHAGTHMVSVGYDGTVRLWSTDPDDPMQLAIDESHQGWVSGLSIDSSQPRIYTSDSFGRIACFDHSNDSLQLVWNVPEAHDGWARDLALSPDGTTLASVGRDQSVKLWDPTTGELKESFDDHRADVYTVAWHPDAMHFATGDAKGIVHFRVTSDESEVRTFDASELFSTLRLQDVGGVQALTFSNDGKTLYAGGCRPNNGGNVQGVPLVLSFDTIGDRPVERLELGVAADVYVKDITLHPDGFMIAVTNGNPGIGKLQLHRFGDEKPFYINTTLLNCHHISLHPNNRDFAVTTTSRGSNGNGRPLRDGKYVGSHSPVHILTFDKPVEE